MGASLIAGTPGVGEYVDDVIGLQYSRARWNDPNIGRFVSIDPFDGQQTHPESLNKYTYAENDPVSNVAPSGFATLQELNATVGVDDKAVRVQRYIGAHWHAECLLK